MGDIFALENEFIDLINLCRFPNNFSIVKCYIDLTLSLMLNVRTILLVRKD